MYLTLIRKNYIKYLTGLFMKILSLASLVVGTSLILSACGPVKVDCSSEQKYNESLTKVMADIQKRDPSEKEKVEKFLKVKNMLTFNSGKIDKDVCGRDADQLVTLSHNFIKDTIDEYKNKAQTYVNDAYKKTEDAFNNAVGNTSEENKKDTE